MAKIAGVSERSIQQAKTIHASAAPEVVAAAKRGDIGAEKAAAIAKMPQAEQAAAINKPLPKPAQKPAPTVVESEVEAPPDYTELDAAKDLNNALQDELVVARMGNVPEEEKTQAAERIAVLQAELHTANATIKALTISRDTLLMENAEMKRQMKAQRGMLDKLRK